MKIFCISWEHIKVFCILYFNINNKRLWKHFVFCTSNTNIDNQPYILFELQDTKSFQSFDFKYKILNTFMWCAKIQNTLI